MNRKASKFIHTAAVSTGATGDELRHAEKALKKEWNNMPWNERHALKEKVRADKRLKQIDQAVTNA